MYIELRSMRLNACEKHIYDVSKINVRNFLKNSMSQLIFTLRRIANILPHTMYYMYNLYKIKIDYFFKNLNLTNIYQYCAL